MTPEQALELNGGEQVRLTSHLISTERESLDVGDVGTVCAIIRTEAAGGPYVAISVNFGPGGPHTVTPDQIEITESNAQRSFDLDFELNLRLEEVQSHCSKEEPQSLIDLLIADWLTMHRELSIRDAVKGAQAS